MRIVLACAVFAIALAGAARRAEACSCRPPAPPAESLARADAVFVAKVVSIDEPGDRGAGRVKAEVEVARWFKGGSGGRAKLSTGDNSAVCGFPLAEGRSYLLYATAAEVGGPFRVSLCSRSMPLDRAGEDLKVLGGAGADSESETESASASETEAESESESETETGAAPGGEAAAPRPAGDLNGRSSKKGRGCAAGAGAGGAAGLLAVALLAATIRRDRGG